MSAVEKKLLNLIANNCSINQIMRELNINYQELYQSLNVLKKHGKNMEKQYYYNGNIVLNQTNQGNQDESQIKLLGDKNQENFNFMVTSDFHIGNASENLQAINAMCNYCKKENISIVLNGGDLLDSIGVGNKFDNYNKLIEYAINKHPFHNNLTHFICLGNHDIDSLEKDGIDLKQVLIKNRPDIIPLGYGYGVLNIKNNYILIEHNVKRGIKRPKLHFPIILSGHSHIMSITFVNDVLTVKIPTLSNLVNGTLNVPSALKLNIIFQYNSIYKVTIEHLVFYNQLHSINKMAFNFQTPEDKLQLLDKKNNNSAKKAFVNTRKKRENRLHY